MSEIPKSKVKTDVRGAPFKVGTHVKVVMGVDETFDDKFQGLIGEIVHFDYSCRCGQTFPNDPMIGVRFAGDVIEEFWQEELSIGI